MRKYNFLWFLLGFVLSILMVSIAYCEVSSWKGATGVTYYSYPSVDSYLTGNVCNVYAVDDSPVGLADTEVVGAFSIYENTSAVEFNGLISAGLGMPERVRIAPGGGYFKFNKFFLSSYKDYDNYVQVPCASLYFDTGYTANQMQSFCSAIVSGGYGFVTFSAGDNKYFNVLMGLAGLLFCGLLVYAVLAAMA